MGNEASTGNATSALKATKRPLQESLLQIGATSCLLSCLAVLMSTPNGTGLATCSLRAGKRESYRSDLSVLENRNTDIQIPAARKLKDVC